MQIGIPKETKPMEKRVGLIPAAVAQLVQAGHILWLETTAGEESGYSDQAYSSVGAQIATTAQLYQRAELIIKVKEPTAADLAYLNSQHILFCYLHLAAIPELTRKLQQIGLTAIGFETVMVNQSLPLLAPMSAIAGQLSIQLGSYYLQAPMGGKGILLSSLGSEPGHVTIIGGGVAGRHAAQLAYRWGAQVTVLDKNPQVLATLQQEMPGVMSKISDKDSLYETLLTTDLLIGAVLIPGAKAPHIVTRSLLQAMPKKGVVVDISVDQGGCLETTRPTDYLNPAYIEEDIVHIAITNLPSAVPRTASQTLSQAILPYVIKLAEGNLWQEQVLQKAVNIHAGNIMHSALL